ncbi:hypothetical protein TTHERM_00245160 (macronuclear) [Tetrahymena thermophila SB210]|uniref:Uncharacterized protein n=1 Tax=Tetrahymena thermophila (strain SB210) TaxID=312017 RepID=Q245Y2_TETTS|nr:hypothetical protein TTHERM_00245160 [Tetrahymena thermophila SB210]EAS03501.2 hypothetical protein TTHERM_00245160 [Tetrahymena thermophila SB210]|eukprot:XP_001023746.2 hypothetical protein TTHERM_00245160 [Tetrahymena thermophila SB210]
MKDDIDEMHKILPKQIILCDEQHDKKRLQKLIDECEVFQNNYNSLIDRLAEMKSSLNTSNTIFSKSKQLHSTSTQQIGEVKTLAGSSTSGSQNQLLQSQQQAQNQKDTLVNGSSSQVSVTSPQNRKFLKKHKDKDQKKEEITQTENKRDLKKNQQKKEMSAEKNTSNKQKNNKTTLQQQSIQKISTKSSGEEAELNKTFASQVINLKGKEKINLQIRYLKDIYELVVMLVKSNFNKLEIFQSKPPVLDEFDDFVKFRKIIEMDRHIISLVDSEKHKCSTLGSDIVLSTYIKEIKLSQELITYTPQFLKVLGDLIQTYQECLTPDLEAYVTSYNEFAKLTLNAKSIQLLRNLFYNLLCFIVKKEIIYIKIPFFIEKIERAFNQITNDRFFFISLNEEQKEIQEDLQQINIIITTFQDKEEKYNQITYTLQRLQLIYRRIKDYHTIFFNSNSVLPSYSEFHPFLRKLYDHIFKGGDEEPLIQESSLLIKMLESGNYKLENDFHNVSEKPRFIPVLEKMNDITENLIYMLKTINQSRESINFFSLLQVLHTIGEYFLIKKEPVVLVRDSKNLIVFIQPLIRKVISDFQTQLHQNSQKVQTDFWKSQKQSMVIQQQHETILNNQSKNFNTSMVATLNQSQSIQHMDEIIKQKSDILQQSQIMEDENQFVLQKTSPLVLQIQKSLLFNEYFGLSKNTNRNRQSSEQFQNQNDSDESEQEREQKQDIIDFDYSKEMEWFEYMEQMDESRIITDEGEINMIQTCVSFVYTRKQQAVIILIPQSPFSQFNYEIADIDTNQIIFNGFIQNNNPLSIPLPISSPYGLFSLRLFKKYQEDNQNNLQNNASIACQNISNNKNNNNQNDNLSRSLYIKTITNNNATNSLESNYAQFNSLETSQYQFTRFEQDQALLVKSMLVNKYNLFEFPLSFKPQEKYAILIQRKAKTSVQYFIQNSNHEKTNIKQIEFIQIIPDKLQSNANQTNKNKNSHIKIEQQQNQKDIILDDQTIKSQNEDLNEQLTTDLIIVKQAQFEDFEFILELSNIQQVQDLALPSIYIYKKQQEANTPDPMPIIIQNNVKNIQKSINEDQNSNFGWRIASIQKEEVKIINSFIP